MTTRLISPALVPSTSTSAPADRPAEPCSGNRIRRVAFAWNQRLRMPASKATPKNSNIAMMTSKPTHSSLYRRRILLPPRRYQPVVMKVKSMRCRKRAIVPDHVALREPYHRRAFAPHRGDGVEQRRQQLDQESG